MSKKLLLGVLVITLMMSVVNVHIASASEIEEPDGNLTPEQEKMYQAIIETVSELGGDEWIISYDDSPYRSFGCSANIDLTPSGASYSSMGDEAEWIWASIYCEQQDNPQKTLDKDTAQLEQGWSGRNDVEGLVKTSLCNNTAVRWDEIMVLYYVHDDIEEEVERLHISSNIVFVYHGWYCVVGVNNYSLDVESIAQILCRNLESVALKNSPPIASFKVFPPNPVPEEPVVLASTSTDPENDSLTFEWYVDGRYDSDFPSCELGMLEAGKYEITLKVTDSHDNTDEITRTIEVAESAYTFKLRDEQMVLYDFNDSYPIVTLELKGMNWQELGSRIGNVAVTFNLQLTGTNNLGSFRWPADGPVSRTILLQYLVRYLEGGLLSGDDPNTIELTIPLYYILRDAGWLDLDEDPRFYLSHKHLAPDSDGWESAQAKVTAIPEQLDLRLVMEPVELFIPAEEIGEPATVIDLSKNPATEASFVLGKKIDLVRDSKLKVGSAPEEPWTAYSDVVVCVLKMTPVGMGAKIALSIVKGFVHLFKGEVGSALLTWVTAPAHIVVDIVLTVPSAAKVADRYSIPSLVLEKSEQALLKLGYTSLKEIPPVAHWPVWVNLDEEKLAFMDPAGILHQVHWPSNLRIPLPYFTMESYIKVEDYPHTALLPPPYRYAQLDAFCQPVEWIEVNTSQNIRVIPYPASFRPVRVTMDNPGELEVLEAEAGLRIWTDGGGVMLLDRGTVDFGYADSPPSPLGPYAIHPGMENQPREPNLKVYREQYVAVWEGTLKVIDEDSGVGIYAGDALEELICKPVAWCRGRGTEYDIEVTPGEGFRVNVIEGQVDVVNRNMVAVEILNAGSGKEYSFNEFLANEHPIADFAIAPEEPTTEDIVLITSLSTDPDGDPLTYSWYVDGEYYAQASNSDGIVLENLKPGKYDIKLIVEDGWGGQGELSATVVIGGDGSFNAWAIIWIAAGSILFLLLLKGLRGKRQKT